MANQNKKIRDEQDKKVLQAQFGKKPKHRCPICHRFTLYNHNDKRLREFNGCIMCYLIKESKRIKEEENARKDSE